VGLDDHSNCALDIALLDVKVERSTVVFHRFPEPAQFVLALRKPEQKLRSLLRGKPALTDRQGPAELLIAILERARPQGALSRSLPVPDRTLRGPGTRGFEVLRQLTGVCANVRPEAALQRLPDPHVQLGASWSRHQLRRRFLDQNVSEAIQAGFAADFLDQSSAEGFLEAFIELRVTFGR